MIWRKISPGFFCREILIVAETKQRAHHNSLGAPFLPFSLPWLTKFYRMSFPRRVVIACSVGVTLALGIANVVIWRQHWPALHESQPVSLGPQPPRKGWAGRRDAVNDTVADWLRSLSG